MTRRSGPEARAEFTTDLVAAGHQIPTGAFGVFGRGAAFEQVVSGLSQALRRLLEPDGSVERLSFPPIVPQAVFEKTDYVTSFPQLIGSVRVFTGDNAAHAEMLAAKSADKDWTGHLAPSHLMMVSAACHPIYGLLSGRLPKPRRFDVIGQCFRHEPTTDPTRMVSFRMHEVVYVGTPDGALEHRERWLAQMKELLAGLGLGVRVDVANDPFFGRAGRILAVGQLEEALKYEILFDIFDDAPTAIASGNAHRDHFGENFGITLSDGSPAHSACFGLGMERTTLALLRQHGMDVPRWPDSVRAPLGM